MSEDYLEHGRRILSAQPFSVLLGTKLTRLETGMTELRLALKPDHMQQHGFAHGGVVSYLADNALTYAGGTVLGSVLTMEMKINYVRPAVGHTLIAIAETLSSGKRQAVCQCKVYAEGDSGRKLCAVAQGTVIRAQQ